MEVWNQLADYFKQLCSCKNNKVDNHVEGGGQFIHYSSKNPHIVQHGSKREQFQKLSKCYIPVKPTSSVIQVKENRIETISQEIDELKEDKTIDLDLEEDNNNDNRSDLKTNTIPMIMLFLILILITFQTIIHITMPILMQFQKQLWKIFCTVLIEIIILINSILI